MFSKSTLAGVTITTYTFVLCTFCIKICVCSTVYLLSYYVHAYFNNCYISSSLGVWPESAGIVTASYENIDLTIFGRLQVIVWL